MSVAESRFYFDTSVLLPLYRQERLTAQAEQLQSETTPVISALTEVEIASALARWVRTEELSEGQARSLEHIFAADLRLGVFEKIGIVDRHYWRARQWLLGLS